MATKIEDGSYSENSSLLNPSKDRNNLSIASKFEIAHDRQSWGFEDFQNRSERGLIQPLPLKN